MRSPAPDLTHTERITKDAPEHIRASVQTIIVGHMAGHLRAHRIDLTDRAAVRAALVEAGFGEPSITELIERATAAAREVRL